MSWGGWWNTRAAVGVERKEMGSGFREEREREERGVESVGRAVECGKHILGGRGL